MRRYTPMYISALAVAATTATTALAISVHLKGEAEVEPAFIDDGLTLGAGAELAGLAYEDVTIVLTAQGDAEVICTDPLGNDPVPGDDPAPVELIGTASVSKDEIEGGSLEFAVTTEPPKPLADAADCPTRRPVKDFVDVAFTDARLEVFQGEKKVLTLNCSFDAPSDDVALTKEDLTCW